MWPTAECPLTNLEIQRQYNGRGQTSIPNGKPIDQGGAVEGRNWQQDRYSCTRGELREKRTGPWESEVSLDPLWREQDQDSPARGPMGRLGIFWEIAN